MPRVSLKPAENSPIKVTQRAGARPLWRARCRLGTLGDTVAVEANSTVSAEDARAKLLAKLERKRTEAVTQAAPVAGSATGAVSEQGPKNRTPVNSTTRSGRGPLLADWVHVWIRAQEGVLEDSSVAAYWLQVKNICASRYPTRRKKDGTPVRGAIDRATIYDISDRALEEISADDIRRFLVSLTKGGSSRRAEIAAVVLRRALDEAMVRGFIDVNPMRRVDPWLSIKLKAMRRGSQRTKAALTAADARKVTEALIAWETRPASRGTGAGSRLSDAWLVMLGSGLRVGEVLALRRSDVDLEAGTIRVCGTISETPKTHRKDKTKSGSTGFVVPIAAEGQKALSRQIACRPLYATVDTIFTSVRGGYWAPSSLRAAMTKAASAAGLDKSLSEGLGRDIHVTTHTARRSVGTWLANSPDAGVMQASQQLRHSSTAVTEAFYVDRGEYVPQTRDVLNAFNGE